MVERVYEAGRGAGARRWDTHLATMNQAAQDDAGPALEYGEAMWSAIAGVTLEDKIVRGAVAEVLNAIYEADFLGFSYGFRPARSAHKALTALDRALMTQDVNWVLDIDIRSFFDTVDHGWLMRMLAHRIADRRVLRLIERWLKAGILESGKWQATEVGTPQGSGISPILANLFLHYVVDLWVR